MAEAVKIELTLEKETVEAFFKMISSLAASLSAQMSDKEENEEESNKEEVKEEMHISNTISINTDNNICNNACMHSNTTLDGSYNKDLNALDTNAIDLNTNAEVTMDQILAYMSQKGYKFDPNKFYSYYRGMGWKTKNGRDIRPIWKETIDQWAKYEYNRSSAKAATTPNKVGMGTREERMAAHPFVPTDFNEFSPV